MQGIKEAAANVAASANSGMEKTKATMQEKMEKVKAQDPIQKDMATQKKESGIAEAEQNKREAMEHNAALSHGGAETASYSATGGTGQSTGFNQMSALPGHGTGQPTGQVVEGVATAHPIGTNQSSYGTGGYNS